MGASSGPPPSRCAGLGCSSLQEGHCGAAARPCPAIRHFMPGRPPSTGDKRLPWPRTLGCSVTARGSAASQHEGLQPQVKLHLHTLPALSHAPHTGQRSHQREHKKQLRHFPGLCSSHSLDTADCSGRAGNMELRSALLQGNEP